MINVQLSSMLLPCATYLRQGNVFTHVCHSVHRADTPWADTPRQTPPPTWADTPTPWADTSPWADTPLGRHHPMGRHPLSRHQPLGRHHPLGRHPPRADTPVPHDGHCGRQYASYWNAFLFKINTRLYCISRFVQASNY